MTNQPGNWKSYKRKFQYYLALYKKETRLLAVRAKLYAMCQLMKVNYRCTAPT
jgi:hypothetical protein